MTSRERLSFVPSLLGWATVLVALVVPGCYHASGQSRSTVDAFTIPASGGDRPAGLKATAVHGDYYIGNDLIEAAVDGTPFHADEDGVVLGGSLIDAGRVTLDSQYKRFSLPSDMLERLTVVVNQDPRLPLVFDAFSPGSDSGEAWIDMQGGLYDTTGLLTGGTPGRIPGIAAHHTIRLSKQDDFLMLETTITNNSGNPVDIRNVSDALSQRGGGFLCNVPATGWGVQNPGTTFDDPLATAVSAPMVALMGTEPSGLTEDVHGSLGILPLSSDALLVNADAQDPFHDARPIVPERVVVGGLAATTSLAPGASLRHQRRLYIVGGASAAGSMPAHATGLFNQMLADRARQTGQNLGFFFFTPVESAQRQGAVPTEIRLERKNGSDWILERTEWMAPLSRVYSGSSPDAFGILLPEGAYRMTLANPLTSLVISPDDPMSGLINVADKARPDLRVPLQIAKPQAFSSSVRRDYLCPERSDVITDDGTIKDAVFMQHWFITRAQDTSVYAYQPARVTVVRQDPGPEANNKRTITLAGLMDSTSRSKVIADGYQGRYLVRQGNEIFGVSLPPVTTNASASANAASLFLSSGTYTACATQGPLSYLERTPVSSAFGASQNVHPITLFKAPLPSGWTSFDMPGPSQMTTGHMLPLEQLSSALAEGVDVVARTEEDRLTDARALRDAFRMDFVPIENASQIGEKPYVIGARTSQLTTDGHGSATALFAPAPSDLRRGGARNSARWTLADFITQAEGQYNVIHRPRGPEGLFTQHAINPGVALGTGSNAWWNATGLFSLGKRQGDFDALELLRGDIPRDNAQQPDYATWFQEFQDVRQDWFAILRQQGPTHFTKALGLSSGLSTLDTPVGLARTYVHAGTFTQDNLSPVLDALRSGACVASTGPLLDVQINGVGPGGFVANAGSVTLTLTVYAPDWVPVDEIRIVIGGNTALTLPFSSLTRDTTDIRKWTYTTSLPLGSTDTFVVVEAGVPLSTTGAYRPDSDWHKIMRGIYPIAVTNPIFLDMNGAGYTPPGPTD